MKLNRLIIALAALGATAASALTVSPLTFTGSSGARSASVSFDVSGTNLLVVLANTSTADARVPTDILTGVFFNIAGNPELSRISATSLGPTYLNGTLVSSAGVNVGGEWAYLNGLSQYGVNSGISSSGLGVFGPSDVFPGANLSGPETPDGLQYGLTTAGDNLATGNGGLMANEITKNSVSFVLGGFTGPLSSISGITFQYGTALDEPSFPGSGGGGGGTGTGSNPAPEPGTIALAGLALLALAAGRRKRG